MAVTQLKWAKVQAYEWDDMLHTILCSNIVDCDLVDGIGLYPTMDANFTLFDEDEEMCDHITSHIVATLAAIGEYREMG